MSNGQGQQNSPLIVDQAERMKLAQALYGVITGKTEKMTSVHNKGYLIKFADIIQLHDKCNAACSQWQIVQKSTSVTVHHYDDNTEQFSSIDRFKIYDVSKTSAVESVVYEMNILMTLPGVQVPQNYKVTVRMLSRVAMIRRMENDMPPPGFFRYFMSGGGIVTEIEYVDYVVARNLLAMIDSWVKEVEQLPDWRVILFAQKYSHWLPSVMQFLMVVSATYVLGTASHAVLAESQTPADLARWLIFALGGVFVCGAVGRFLGRFVERAIDDVAELSAIAINRGDERLIERAKRRNRLHVLKIAGGTLFAAIEGVVVSNLQYLIKAIF
jgi:hypothetical protein